MQCIQGRGIGHLFVLVMRLRKTFWNDFRKISVQISLMIGKVRFSEVFFRGSNDHMKAIIEATEWSQDIMVMDV